MNSPGTTSHAVSLIAAMITPALLILAAASLIASGLVRMGRVVDRARVLASAAHDATWDSLGLTCVELGHWLRRHGQRARYAERCVLVLFCAVVVFVATGLSIALDVATGDRLGWLPVSLSVAGSLLLLLGGGWMVAESRLSAAQIAEEIQTALLRLQERKL